MRIASFRGGSGDGRPRLPLHREVTHVKSHAGSPGRPQEVPFEGFPKECVRFWANVAKHNNKTWFEAHRADYERFVLEPSKQFVIAMGERLHLLSPRVSAVPAVNKSLFRIHRDTRFSPDKRPFKTYMGIYFWEGEGKRWECSGYYFHVEPPTLMLGAGIYVFPKALLPAYREAVNDKPGQELERTVKRLTASGAYSVGGEHYKRVPSGYDAQHPRAKLLRHNGLHALFKTGIPTEFYTPAILDYCFDRWRDMTPLHSWLVRLTQAAAT